ncbi:MAG: hypothetical protein HFG54_09860 [Lachnospiraceae bacterium]|jgi:hypothetical protein|nr:hypothetical protein [Lachnospiraceae bacterium]
MRIQFYPSDELKDKLNNESNKLGVSISVLVNDILNKHYGLIPPDALTDLQIEKKVLDEILVYIKDESHMEEFDLNMASDTFSKIDMIYAGKPRILKARLGKTFAKLIGTGNYKYVKPVMLANGKPKRTVGNRAAIYRIDWEKMNEDKTS